MPGEACRIVSAALNRFCESRVDREASSLSTSSVGVLVAALRVLRLRKLYCGVLCRRENDSHERTVVVLTVAGAKAVTVGNDTKIGNRTTNKKAPEPRRPTGTDRRDGEAVAGIRVGRIFITSTSNALEKL